MATKRSTSIKGQTTGNPQNDPSDLLEQRTRELEASEARFRNVISKIADGIIIVDREGIVRFINPAAESLFDRRAEELIGTVFGFPLVAGETTEREPHNGYLILQGGLPETEEFISSHWK